MKHQRRHFILNAAALGLAATTSSLPARADDASDARGVVDKATATVRAFAADKDYASLPSLLAKARAVLVYPQIIEGGFIIGGSGGSGVLLVHNAKTGEFGSPAFYSMGGVSIGFLAGGQAAEVLLLINSQKALDSLLSSKVKLGADISIAVGPKGGGQGVAADIVSFAKAKGAFASLALNGQVIEARDKLNAAYYGRPVSPLDILIKGSVSHRSSAALQAALKSAAK